jgi:lysyl-tRNA synthetase class I
MRKIELNVSTIASTKPRTAKSVQLSDSVKDVVKNFESSEFKYQRAASMNPLLPKKIAMEYINQYLGKRIPSSHSIALKLCANPTLDEKCLLEIANKLKWEFRFCAQAIVDNPNCTSKILFKLMQSQARDIRCSAAHSDKLGAKGAELALHDTNAEVRSALAANEKWVVKYAPILIKDKAKSVRRYLVQNKNTPIEILNALLGDKDVSTRNMAIERLRDRLSTWR